jgi:hypothetical protein
MKRAREYLVEMLPPEARGLIHLYFEQHGSHYLDILRERLSAAGFTISVSALRGYHGRWQSARREQRMLDSVARTRALLAPRARGAS